MSEEAKQVSDTEKEIQASEEAAPEIASAQSAAPESLAPEEVPVTEAVESSDDATSSEEAAPSVVELPADVFDELTAKVAKVDEYWDRILRISAEFDNFRKRSARDRQEAVKYANESLLAKLVTVLDHFEAALQATEQAQETSLESFKTGIGLIYNQLKTVMNEAGLEEIDAQNQVFNPRLHEAVSQTVTTEIPDGQVLQQLRKGYKLRDRLIRPAGVVVATRPVE